MPAKRNPENHAAGAIGIAVSAASFYIERGLKAATGTIFNGILALDPVTTRTNTIDFNPYRNNYKPTIIYLREAIGASNLPDGIVVTNSLKKLQEIRMDDTRQGKETDVLFVTIRPREDEALSVSKLKAAYVTQDGEKKRFVAKLNAVSIRFLKKED